MKKALSVLLSLLMVITTISVVFTLPTSAATVTAFSQDFESYNVGDAPAAGYTTAWKVYDEGASGYQKGGLPTEAGWIATTTNVANASVVTVDDETLTTGNTGKYLYLGDWAGIGMTAAVEPNTTYTLTFKHFANIANNASQAREIHVYDVTGLQDGLSFKASALADYNNNALTRLAYNRATPSPALTWNSHTFTFTTGANADKVLIYFHTDAPKGFYIDDVKLTYEAKPTVKATTFGADTKNGGVAWIDGDVTSATEGMAVTYKAMPYDSAIFDGWYVDGTKVSSETTLVRNWVVAETVEAKFKAFAKNYFEDGSAEDATFTAGSSAPVNSTYTYKGPSGSANAWSNGSQTLVNTVLQHSGANDYNVRLTYREISADNWVGTSYGGIAINNNTYINSRATGVKAYSGNNAYNVKTNTHTVFKVVRGLEKQTEYTFTYYIYQYGASTDFNKNDASASATTSYAITGIPTGATKVYMGDAHVALGTWKPSTSASVVENWGEEKTYVIDNQARLTQEYIVDGRSVLGAWTKHSIKFNTGDFTDVLLNFFSAQGTFIDHASLYKVPEVITPTVNSVSNFGSNDGIVYNVSSVYMDGDTFTATAMPYGNATFIGFYDGDVLVPSTQNADGSYTATLTYNGTSTYSAKFSAVAKNLWVEDAANNTTPLYKGSGIVTDREIGANGWTGQSHATFYCVDNSYISGLQAGLSAYAGDSAYYFSSHNGHQAYKVIRGLEPQTKYVIDYWIYDNGTKDDGSATDENPTYIDNTVTGNANYGFTGIPTGATTVNMGDMNININGTSNQVRLEQGTTSKDPVDGQWFKVVRWFNTGDSTDVLINFGNVASTIVMYDHIALYEAPVDMIVANGNEGGYVKVDGNIITSTEVAIGSTVTLTAEPFPGNKFLGWYADASLTGEAISREATLTVTATNGAKYYAKFKNGNVLEDYSFENIPKGSIEPLYETYGWYTETTSGYDINGWCDISVVGTTNGIVPYSGNNMIEVNHHSNAGWFKNIAVEPNTTYTLSFKYAVAFTKESAKFYGFTISNRDYLAYADSTSGHYIVDDSFGGNDYEDPITVEDKVWNTYTVTFNSGTLNSINMMAQFASAKMYFDDMTLVKHAAPAASVKTIAPFGKETTAVGGYVTNYVDPENLNSITYTAVALDGNAFLGWYEGENLISSKATISYNGNLTAKFMDMGYDSTLDGFTNLYSSATNGFDGSFESLNQGFLIGSNMPAVYIGTVDVVYDDDTTASFSCYTWANPDDPNRLWEKGQTYTEAKLDEYTTLTLTGNGKSMGRVEGNEIKWTMDCPSELTISSPEKTIKTVKVSYTTTSGVLTLNGSRYLSNETINVNGNTVTLSHNELYEPTFSGNDTDGFTINFDGDSAKNPGFGSIWSYSSRNGYGGIKVVDDVSYDGSKSLLIREGVKGAAVLNKLTGLQKNTDYVASFWYYIPEETGTNLLNEVAITPTEWLGEYNTGELGKYKSTALGYYDGTYENNVYGKWAKASVSFNTGELTEVVLHIVYSGGDYDNSKLTATNCYIDNLELKLKADYDAAASAAFSNSLESKGVAIRAAGTDKNGNEVKQALRFKTRIAKNYIEEMVLGADYTVIEYGSIAMRADAIDEKANFTIDYKDANGKSPVRGVTYRAETGTNRIFQYKPNERDLVFTAALTGITEANYKTDYSVRTYAIVELTDGSKVTIYDTNVYTTNVFYIATQAVEKETDPEVVAYLNKLIEAANSPSQDGLLPVEEFNPANLGLENATAIEDVKVNQEGTVVLNGGEGTNPEGNVPTFYTEDNTIRTYAGNTLTISTMSTATYGLRNVETPKNIKSIEFTYVSDDYADYGVTTNLDGVEIVPDETNLKLTINNINAREVILTFAAKARITNIKVTYEEVTPCADGAHTYTDNCDEECNVCYAVRNDAPHNFASDCDAVCDCGETREALTECANFDSVCDTTCNDCDAERVAPHQFTNACQAKCDFCDAVNPAPAEHQSYDNACDTTCNDCGAERVATHDDDDILCDTVCGNCDAVVVPKAEHVYNEDGVCSNCSAKEQYTVNVSIADYAAAKGWVNDNYTQYDNVIINEYITATAGKISTGKYTGKYFTDWRFYQTDSGELTITAAAGYIVKSVKVTYKSEKSGVLLNGTEPAESGDVVPVNAQSITLTVGNTGAATNGQARITAIEVVYENVGRCPDDAHVYDNSCDTSCNVCNAQREATHKDDAVLCDTKCSVCGEAVAATAQHTADACLSACELCGAEVVPTHKFAGDCDTTCECGATREAEHSYVDGACEYCGTEEPAQGPTTLATFEFGDNVTAGSKNIDSNSTSLSGTKTYSENGYNLTLEGISRVYDKCYDDLGNSCLKLGSSSKAGTFNFTVADNVTKVIIRVKGYKSSKSIISVNGTNTTINASSSTTTVNGQCLEIEVDTSTNKTVSITTVTGGWRIAIDSIEFVGIPA